MSFNNAVVLIVIIIGQKSRAEVPLILLKSSGCFFSITQEIATKPEFLHFLIIFNTHCSYKEPSLSNKAVLSE